MAVKYLWHQYLCNNLYWICICPNCSHVFANTCSVRYILYTSSRALACVGGNFMTCLKCQSQRWKSLYRSHCRNILTRWSRFDFRISLNVFLLFVFRFSLFVFRFSLFVFRYSDWVGKSYFDIQNLILRFELSRKILFWYPKSYFDIRTESENPILTFKILFWHSNWVGKSYLNIQNVNVGKTYFDIQTPILTFALSRKILFWYSKSYFDIRTESENHILISKILFWHLHWIGTSYFDIQNPILTFELSRNILF